MSDRQDSNWDESHGSASSGISDSAGNAPEPEIISQEDYERLYHPTRDQCPAFQHRFQDREDYAESTLDPVLCEHGVDRRPVPFGQGLSQESSTPSAGFPSFKYNLLDYLDIEGPPSSLQSFANHAVIRMYNNHPEAFSGPLDPRKLPYPYHPSATLVLEVQQPPSKPATTPQSRQVHHSNLKRLCAANEYDPLWMKCNNVNEPVLEEVRSRKKFEELFRYEVIAQGDRLVMEVVYTTSQGEKILGEANFVFNGFYTTADPSRTKFFPDLDFSIAGTNIQHSLPGCRGTNTIVEFLQNRDITLRTKDIKTVARRIHVYRGAQDHGDLYYVKQAFHYWFYGKDMDAEQTGQPWRRRRRLKDGKYSIAPALELGKTSFFKKKIAKEE